MGDATQLSQSKATAPSSGSPRYVLDDRQNAYRRLVEFAGHLDDMVRGALRFVDLGDGARIIDVGYGPIGALLPLAIAVGPTGNVVGFDVDPKALQKASEILGQQGITNVSLLQGDLHRMDSAAIYGERLFDAAYSRFFLIHQADPVEALRRMASLVRPGGYLIIHDWLIDRDYPTFDPPVPAVSRVVELAHAVMSQRGASPDAARSLGSSCRRAGLRELRQLDHTSMGTTYAPLYLSNIYNGLDALRAAILEHQITTAEDVDCTRAALEQAATGEFQDFIGWFNAELIAQVPDES
jgi:ubiquinone/menaquinone biosynthesis C-methylase UbiE